MPISRDPEAQIIARIAFAKEVCRAVYPRVTEFPPSESILLELAGRVFARAAVWQGQDPILLAEEANDVVIDEEVDNDDRDVIFDLGGEYDVPGVLVAEAVTHLVSHGAPPHQDRERAHALYVDILAGLMHAIKASTSVDMVFMRLGGTSPIFDAAERFQDIHNDPRVA